MYTLKHYFLNTRPYSWIDLVFLGLLAKYSLPRHLIFTKIDIYVSFGLLCLWIFYNLILEHKHSYKYRGKVSVPITFVFLLIPILISIYTKSYQSLVFIFISSIFVYIYLQKNKNLVLGILSSLIRGLIQVNYFMYALYFLHISLQKEHLVLSIIIFFLYTSRAIVGDIRDIKHNTIKNKKTIPVLCGERFSRRLVTFMLLSSSVLLLTIFNNYIIILPLVIFSLTLLTYKNGYVLHQLSINTTMFFFIIFIGLSTDQNILYLILIYLGIYLNMVFYPSLKRKSNPTFTN